MPTLTDRVRHLLQENSYLNLRSSCRHRFYLQNQLFQFDRTGKKMTVAPVKEEKDYRFQDDIIQACIVAMEKDSIPSVEVSFIKSRFILSIFVVSY